MSVTELWRPVPNHDGDYEVSSTGRVSSFKRGGYRMLRPRPLPIGYLRVNLVKNRKATDYYIHRLVAEAFIPNPFGYPYVNHRDGDRGNNDISNLEWCTQHHNLSHAVANGLMLPQRGESNYAGTKLNDDDVRAIRVLNEWGLNTVFVAEMFGVSHSLISGVNRGVRWSHVQ